jgi:protein subunit release factor B
MIMLSFRSKKDKERMLRKAKEMEMYAAELVDCLEEARHGERDEYEDEEEEYSERNNTSMRMRGGRYGYRR